MKTLILVGSLIAILVLAIVYAAGVWFELGNVGMTWHGYLAMGLGISLSLGLGVGLMALVFISSRRGYDDQAGSENRPDSH